jgi:hypothetical protein
MFFDRGSHGPFGPPKGMKNGHRIVIPTVAQRSGGTCCSTWPLPECFSTERTRFRVCVRTENKPQLLSRCHSLFHTHKSERVPHVRTSVRGVKKTGRSPIKGLSFPLSQHWFSRKSVLLLSKLQEMPPPSTENPAYSSGEICGSLAESLRNTLQREAV